MSRRYSRKPAGLKDEPGCCLHGNMACSIGGGGDDRRNVMSATSEDDVFGLCSSKNDDVRYEDDDVTDKATAGSDDVIVTDAGRELQHMISFPIKSYDVFVLLRTTQERLWSIELRNIVIFAVVLQWHIKQFCQQWYTNSIQFQPIKRTQHIYFEGFM